MTKSDLTAMRREIEKELQKSLLERETVALFLAGMDIIREEKLSQKKVRKYIDQGLRSFPRNQGKSLTSAIRAIAVAKKVANRREWVKTYRQTFLRAVKCEIWKQVKAKWPRRPQK